MTDTNSKPEAPRAAQLPDDPTLAKVAGEQPPLDLQGTIRAAAARQRVLEETIKSETEAIKRSRDRVAKARAEIGQLDKLIKSQQPRTRKKAAK